MQTIKLEIEGSKVDIVLNIIRNLKDNSITQYEIVNDRIKSKDFTKLSQSSFETIWDNDEDGIYGKFF